MSLDVVLDLSVLERTEKGSIVARVWLVLDGYAFPERAWSDLVVVVLGWWSEQLLQSDTDGATLTLLFMDGPYSARLRPDAEDDDWSVSLLRDRGPSDGRQDATGVVDLTEFAASVLTAAREVIEACKQKGWSDDPEVVKLGRLSDALSARLSPSRP
jgi:hypothetical protein